MRTHLRGLSRVLATTAIVGVGVALAALPASAHVEFGEGEYHAGAEAVITLSVPHGCDGSPTTKIRIQLPEALPTVTPTVNPGWDISLVTEQLDTPIDLGEGRTLTQRVTEVDYTAKTPLPAEFRDVFSLAVDLPEDSAGTTLTFPTIQECAVGSANWTQVPADGQDPEELQYPAPSIEVLSAVDDGDPSASSTIKPTTTVAASSDDDRDDDGGTKGIAIAALALAVVGLGLGGRALAASKSARSS